MSQTNDSATETTGSSHNQCQSVLLVSTDPVDGYPPVQNQAILFARAGYRVDLITSPRSGLNKCEFEHPGVFIHSVHLTQPSRYRRLLAKAKLLAAICKLRMQSGDLLAAEVAYSADGVWFSNCAPLRRKSAIWIAHLHEAFIDPRSRFFERNALRLLHRFNHVVVADRNRGKLLQDQTGLKQLPLTLPNYPLLPTPEDTPPSRKQSEGFQVVYAGSIGFNQGLGAVIRSVPKWHAKANLQIAGDNTRPQGLEMMRMVESLGLSDRVTFLGTLPLRMVLQLLSNSDLGLTLYCPNHEVLKFSAGASNKRYQCMQAGIAQISDLNPDVPEMIEGQGLGRCVDPDSPDAIAKAVNYYVSNEEECREAGRRAFAAYLDRYHYEIPFGRLLECVRFNSTKGSRKSLLSF